MVGFCTEGGGVVILDRGGRTSRGDFGHGLRDARRRHDPTRPLRHRNFRLLAVSKITPMFESSPDRFPCSTGASAPRPRPARTRTASSPCRSKRSASSDTTRACPYLLSISLARAARRGFFLLVYISVHLANTATKRAAGSEVSSFKKPAGRRPLSLNLRRAARPGSSRRVDGTAPLGSTLAADSYNILPLASRM